MDEKIWDVVIVGGGAAGLSAGVALARFRRSVLLLDAGDPRNAPAGHVHNFLTRDGTPPAELYAAGRAEFIGYGGRVETVPVGELRRIADGFAISAGERVFRSRRLLVATGLRDELPNLPGLAEQWGRGVLHCPYCHGWEVRDRRIGVLSTGPAALHQVQLFAQLSAAVTLLTHTGPAVDEAEREQLAARGIAIVEGAVTAVESAPDANGDDLLTGVRLADGSSVALDALVVGPVVAARAELLEPIGLAPVAFRVGEHVMGTRVPAEPNGATSVPGLWVAGNVTDPQAQVITAAAAGLTAGAAINADLVQEDIRRAVAEQRFDREHSPAAWEARYESAEQLWSGRPNEALVAEVRGLPAGTALDAGAGEGADALWLAEQGWTVTGLDLSAAALRRAAAEADRRGLTVRWRQGDLTREAPEGRYDLVSAFYLHLPTARRREVFARLAAAVAPGGRLLVVGHDPRDMAERRPELAETGWSPAELVADLGAGWRVEVAEVRRRSGHDAHAGQADHDQADHHHADHDEELSGPGLVPDAAPAGAAERRPEHVRDVVVRVRRDG